MSRKRTPSHKDRPGTREHRIPVHRVRGGGMSLAAAVCGECSGWGEVLQLDNPELHEPCPKCDGSGVQL